MSGVFNLRHVASVKFKTSAKSCTFSPGGKEFSIEGLEEGGIEAIALIVDGDFYEWLPGAQTEKTFSTTVFHEGELTDGSTATLYDALMKTGSFAADTTIDPGGLVWTGNIEIILTRGAVSVTVTLPNVRLNLNYIASLQGNTMPVSGRWYGTPTLS